METMDGGPRDAVEPMSGPEKEEPVLHSDLASWMSKLPPLLKTISIIHLAIPGSHDTMTYTIDRNNDVGPDESAIVRFFGRFLSIFSKPIIFNWSVTQHEDIKVQLNGGIRYLDLRIATKPGEREMYYLHGLYGAEISQPLRDVADWLSSHPGEVVILDFQHFYRFDETQHQLLIEMIQDVFKGKLCPVYARFNHISLQWLALEKYQVIVIYRDIAAKNQTYMWPSGTWPTPWPNTVHPEYLLQFLNEKLESRLPQAGFVSQCLLTPDTPYVVRHFCGSLERDLVTLCWRTILPWINEQTPGKGGLNVVITDFVSHENFVFSKTVIQRNAKLLRMSMKTPSGAYIEVKENNYSSIKTAW